MTIAQCKAARNRAMHDPRYSRKGTPVEVKTARRARAQAKAVAEGRSFGGGSKKGKK